MTDRDARWLAATMHTAFFLLLVASIVRFLDHAELRVVRGPAVGHRPAHAADRTGVGAVRTGDRSRRTGSRPASIRT
ncbi:hypothetical protein [Amycolatopsis rubida]|uniref:Uncharacterized protein n=1 Tax=Amycolatopsis rubida TaxID=112413 RepID=A0A1I5HUY6_9PSEU|nr:hypothetical protein [Amycolatopsis rubida]SFO52124.1 hypothetical protein SAMN05421854_10293 [Amycolatopsis rubida]